MFTHSTKLVLTTTLLAALCACNGGGGGGTHQQVTTTVSLGADQTIAKGLTHAFTAFASRSNGGAPRDCTADAVWSSSDPAVAPVAAGVATGLAVGTATISATCDGANASVQLVVTAAALVRLDVTASDAAIPVGANARFTATGTYTDGSTVDLTGLVAWSSSDLAIATVSSGVATGVGQGTATVRAEAAGEISGTASLQVTEAVLVSVAVQPGAPIPLGLRASLVARGTYSDDTVHDVTNAVTWTSSDPTVVTVSNAAGAEGLATGVGLGTATVRAQAAGGISGAASVQVTEAMLVSVAVQPVAPIALGLGAPLAALGTYSDDTVHDVTNAVTWSSSDPSVVTVSNAAGTKGIATSVGQGTATVRADAPGGISGTASLQVTEAALVSVAVQPVAPIPLGLGASLAAVGTYSDNTVRDVTTVVTWSSSDASVATVSNAAGAEGLATGVGLGTATVRAQAAGGISGTASVQVTEAVLVSVAVQPAAPIALGLGAPLAALGTYSDDTVHDVTNAVTWTSSDPSVVTVSNAAGTQGLATGVGLGTATVRAEAAGGISGTASLQVTEAVLTSLAVQPVEPIALGLGAALAARGTYSDSTVHDLTNAVTWSSSDESVVTVSNAAGTEGVATGVGLGTATVRAEAAGGISGTVSLRVIDAVLTSVTVQPVAPIALGLGVPLVATGHYSDGSELDLTNALTWTSSDASVVTVSNAAGTEGVAIGVGQGSATVTATSASGQSSEVLITVTAAQLVLVEVAPIDPTIVVGTILPLAATGTYTDDSTADLTGAPGISWASSNPAVVSVDAAGVLTAVGVGSATVTATDLGSGLSGSTLVTVSAPAAKPALSYLLLSKGSILGGGSVTGTVALTQPAGSDVAVSLSTNGGNAAVPATVVIPAGSIRARFTITTTAPTKKKVRVRISASYDGVTKIAYLNVRQPH